MALKHIGYDDAIHHMSWPRAVEALRAGHRLPRAEIADVFLGPSEATFVSRSAFIEGFGYGVKAFTVVQGNAERGLATTQGGMMLFDPQTGSPTAIIDSRLITEIKTCSDSVLGAQLLARRDSRRLLILGGGPIAVGLVGAYQALFPDLAQIAIWTRRPEQARAIVAAASSADVEWVVADDLPRFAAQADIVSSATMAHEPVLRGAWLSPGTHVDLIGAFKADMREADDELITRGALFVDSRETTLAHIGELRIPLAAGLIQESDVLADLYDLVSGVHPGRSSDGQITVFKNGGGAHLDLMIARYIAETLTP
jgi:ornithine cyclodeaminase